MVKSLRAVLLALGAAIALYGAASLTGGWLGEAQPPGAAPHACAGALEQHADEVVCDEDPIALLLDAAWGHAAEENGAVGDAALIHLLAAEQPLDGRAPDIGA